MDYITGIPTNITEGIYIVVFNSDYDNPIKVEARYDPNSNYDHFYCHKLKRYLSIKERNNISHYKPTFILKWNPTENQYNEINI